MKGAPDHYTGHGCECCDGLGYLLHQGSQGRYRIQRCDCCETYESDSDANIAALDAAKAASKASKYEGKASDLYQAVVAELRNFELNGSDAVAQIRGLYRDGEENTRQIRLLAGTLGEILDDSFSVPAPGRLKDWQRWRRKARLALVSKEA